MNYAYDNASCLKSVTSSLDNQSWTYDKNGNRAGQTWGGITTPYSATAVGNRFPGVDFNSMIPTIPSSMESTGTKMSGLAAKG